jgi:hypothetical protein
MTSISSEPIRITDDGRHAEGASTKAIEKITTKIPSDAFLWTAFGAIGASATLQLMGYKKTSLFVGQWVPTILILGMYNKMVKLLGHETSSRKGL